MQIISGKNILMRTVESNDAEFVFAMRQNKKKTKYLSAVNGTVEDQKLWIENYKKKEADNQEYYFIIESKKHEKLGLVRVYDFIDDSFCWGSWLIKEDAPKTTAIESALQIYKLGFETLAFQKSHFEVVKKNERVIAFHKRFGAIITSEDQNHYYFEFTKDNYQKAKVKYKRYL